MPDATRQARAMPRKLPKQARSLATVAAIIEAAARILEDGGHTAFSTNAVADHAGVSVGSLYQYFPDKDALMGALIARETALLVEEIDIAARIEGGRAALSAFIAACIAHQFRRPRLARLLDFEEARLPADPAVQRVGARVQGLVAGILGKADLPRQAEVGAATRDLVAIVKGMIDAAGQHGETDHGPLAVRVRRAAFGYLGSTIAFDR